MYCKLLVKHHTVVNGCSSGLKLQVGQHNPKSVLSVRGSRGLGICTLTLNYYQLGKPPRVGFTVYYY